MKKIYVYMLGAMLATPVCAQETSTTQECPAVPEGTIETYRPTGGRMLTMEDVFSTELTPENKTFNWRPGTAALISFEQGALLSVNPMEGLNGEILSKAELESLTGSSDAKFECWIDKDRAAFSCGGSYHIINVGTKTGECSFKIPENSANFTFSPKGFHVFTKDNGLYFCDNRGNVYPIAEPQDKNITYGQYVSRNEFGINGGIFLSESGDKVAFYRKDESAVGTFPLLDINTRTGSLFEIKYPMAGMASENVRLGIYDFASNTTVYAEADDFGYDQYLTNISWSPDDKYIFIQVLDRSQKNMNLNMYDASTGKFVRTLLSEHDDRYVEPLDPIHFVKGSNTKFIYRTNVRDGYRNLYLCDTDGNIERLTCTDADVEYVGNDGKNVFYTSAEVSPVENHLFRMDMKSRKAQQLTDKPGWHNVSVSPDGAYFLDNYSSVNVPRVIDLRSTSGKGRSLNLLTASNPVADYAFCELSLGKIKSADGKYDNWYRLIKPKDFDPTKKYPVILYVYGGPHSQLVRNTWLAELRRWEMLMAQKGYIVYVQDNRGTMNRGAEYEKTIYGKCGQAEMSDQMEGIRMLMSLPFVDKDRIGVHGWSYGGFMTISLITNYPDIFKVAVAGGPVIDWKWYEVMYGERYMGNPETNAEGYALTSLIPKAKDLKGKLLICQGAVDNVVVWQHSLNFVNECIRNNVQVDYFPYPCAQHNVAGKDRIHLMDKVTMYFEDYLK